MNWIPVGDRKPDAGADVLLFIPELQVRSTKDGDPVPGSGVRIGWYCGDWVDEEPWGFYEIGHSDNLNPDPDPELDGSDLWLYLEPTHWCPIEGPK